MISEEVIAGLDDSTQESVRHALTVLATSGIIEAQLSHELDLAIRGAFDEDASEVAKKILAFRRKAQALESIKELGLSFTEGTDDE